MTQKDKELLLKDLCARLPYGVMCNIGLNHPLQLQRIFVDRLDGILLDFYEDGKNYQVYLSEVKPYLFPLESMTEEQSLELEIITDGTIGIDTYSIWDFTGYSEISLSKTLEIIQWCYQNHFDINRLIPMGLAIDATNVNIY